MSPSLLSSNTPIYTIVEDDLQEVARHRLHRSLTRDELDSASHYFANAMDWWEVAECAVDCAVDEHA